MATCMILHVIIGVILDGGGGGAGGCYPKLMFRNPAITYLCQSVKKLAPSSGQFPYRISGLHIEKGEVCNIIEELGMGLGTRIWKSPTDACVGDKINIITIIYTIAHCQAWFSDSCFVGGKAVKVLKSTTCTQLCI